MPSRLRAALAPALVFVFVAGSPLLAQKSKTEPPPGQTVREEARVVVVEVPVNVTDKNGHPVENLTAEDFEVFDDGKLQKITGFEIIDERKNIPPPLPGEPPINPAASRHFMMVFDLSFSTSRGILSARKSARDFVVTRMKDLDTCAVATYMVEQGMRLLVPFTSDRTQLAAALDSLGLPSFTQRAPDPLGFLTAANPTENLPLASTGDGGSALEVALGEALENITMMQNKSARAMYRDRVQRMLDSFAQVAVALDSVPGRKHILYFSEGFDGRELSGATGPNAGQKDAESIIHGQSWKVDNDLRYGNTGLRDMMQKALVLFNRSDCTIHSVDIGGLRTGVSTTSNDRDVEVNGWDSLYAFAEQTGGEFLKNANELGPSLEQILERTGLIYLLAFQPVRVPENGKFHPLKVKVKTSSSYRVSARSGYYEPKSNQQLTPLEKKLAMSSAVAAAVPKTDIPAWVLAAAFPAQGARSRVPVILEVPGDRLLVKHDKPVMNVEVFVYAVDKAGTTQDSLYQTIGIDLGKAGETLRKTGIKFYSQLFLPPGEYTLRVLVRDSETGRFGVTVNALSVPETKAPFALPPLFIDSSRQWIMVKARPRGADEEQAEYPFAIGGESFVPAALAGVKSGQETQVCLFAYNFDPANPPLDYSGRILGVDGKPHGKVSFELVKSSSKGERPDARKILLRFRPSGLNPGRYALAVTLLDSKTGKSSESSFPFDVE